MLKTDRLSFRLAGVALKSRDTNRISLNLQDEKRLSNEIIKDVI